jgi:excisionase family DNA binding protein
MTPQEVAEYLRISLSKVYQMTARNELPHMRLGGPRSSLRFDVADVRRKLAVPAGAAK